jgi:WhiB family transcriptional regulator, redox-sensing transcriptional regulator
MTQYVTDWRETGACLSADPDLFFPIAARQTVQAQRICAGCRVRQECLDFAMKTGEAHGIWGGTTPEERFRIRRQHARRRRSWQEAPGTRAS